MGAGLLKITESSWQHGNALYSTMQLPDYRPFPWLSDLFSHSQMLLALITYVVLDDARHRVFKKASTDGS